MKIFDMKPTKYSKLRWIATIIFSGCLLSSCASKPPTQNQNQSSTPFIFRSLDLKQRRPDGVRDWELKSPEARYNTAARKVRARIPKGILYFEDKPSFMISAKAVKLHLNVSPGSASSTMIGYRYPESNVVL